MDPTCRGQVAKLFLPLQCFLYSLTLDEQSFQYRGPSNKVCPNVFIWNARAEEEELISWVEESTSSDGFLSRSQTGPERSGPSQTVSRYAGRVEPLCGWHGSLPQPHAVCMTKSGVNKHTERRRNARPCPCATLSLRLCCASTNNREENPAGCYDTFPAKSGPARMTTSLQQCSLSTTLGKQTPRMRKQHALLIIYPSHQPFHC